MTFKVAVASSDHTLDQYIFEPVVVALLKHLGKPLARVKAIQNPRIQGDAEYFERMEELLEKYAPASDVVLFVFDLDCEDGLDGRKNRLERVRGRIDSCDEKLRSKALFVCAVNELEVWALWGSRQDLGASWAEVRAECHPKELYFEPLVDKSERFTPDKGRRRLIARSLAGGWTSLSSGCTELGLLEGQFSAVVN